MRSYREFTGTPSLFLQRQGINLVFGGASNGASHVQQSEHEEMEPLIYETGDTPPFEDRPEKILKDNRFPLIPKDKSSMDYRVYYDPRFKNLRAAYMQADELEKKALLEEYEKSAREHKEKKKVSVAQKRKRPTQRKDKTELVAVCEKDSGNTDLWLKNAEGVNTKKGNDVSVKPGINVSIGSRVERSTDALNKSDGVNTDKGNDVSINPGINIVSIGSRVERSTKVVNKGNDVSIKPGINNVSIGSRVKGSTKVTSKSDAASVSTKKGNDGSIKPGISIVMKH